MVAEVLAFIPVLLLCILFGVIVACLFNPFVWQAFMNARYWDKKRKEEEHEQRIHASESETEIRRTDDKLS